MQLSVLATKEPDGSVLIYHTQQEAMAKKNRWVRFDRFDSNKPDYRHKWITLNCYRYAIQWMK